MISKFIKVSFRLSIFFLIFFCGFQLNVGQVSAGVCFCDCYEESGCHWDPSGQQWFCFYDECYWATSWNCADESTWVYSSCVYCSDCGGCFTGETEISVGESENSENSENSETKQIKDLKEGDIVSSFVPETGEIKEGTVSDVTKTTREGYYILETESGEKVKVTGEHPFLAIKAKNNGETEKLKNQETTLDKLKDIFSYTLTYRLITSLQTNITEALDSLP